MDFIIEASGVSDAVDKATAQRKQNKDKVRNRPSFLCSLSFQMIFDLLQEMLGSNGEPLYFTKQNVTDTLGDEEAKKVEVFETLDKTYSEEQVIHNSSYKILLKLRT